MEGTKEGLKEYTIFIYALKGLTTVKKVEVSHKLFGHAQVKNNKRYEFGGIINTMKGKKLGKGSVMIPTLFEEDLERFFDLYHLTYEKLRIFTKEEL